MTLFWALLVLLATGDSPPTSVRSTVWIRAGDRSNGTGWVVDTGRRWIVTAAHVVADRDSVEVYFLDRTFSHSITDRRHYIGDRADLQRRGLTATGRLIGRRDNADLALLALDRLPAIIREIPLADESARSGDACRSVGHRHDSDLLWTLTTGHVRQCGRLPDGYFTAGRRIGAGVPLVLVQSPIEAGESGSALLNDAGHAIGMVSAVVNQTPGLAVAIDVSEIRSLIADTRKEAATSPHSLQIQSRADTRALARSTVWVRPQSTDGRAAGVLINLDRKLVLTSAAAVGTEPVVDVVAPKRDEGRLIAEADAYSDRLGLRLSGHCVAGMVLARDPSRDLAVVELDEVPPGLEPIELAAAAPRMGDRVATMGHPTGIDLLWLYAAGAVRSVGAVDLTPDSRDRAKVQTTLLQLPHQSSAAGGPVVNEAGELVGILAAREAARQELAYAATPGEIRTFLDAAKPLWRPHNSGEWQRRGRLATRLGRHATAVDAFETAVRLSPDDIRVWAGYATALYACSHAADALRVAEKASGMNADAAALAQLADVFLRARQPDRASALADRALKTDGRCAAALIVRARLRTRPEAMNDVAEAILIEPGHPAAYEVRARLRDATSADGRREAIADWSRALELQPTDLDALRERARLFAAAREPKKAVADWVRLTELEPRRADNWFALARAKFAASDRSGAADAVRSALRVDPARKREAFALIRSLGNELEEDNPADRERVAKWYADALDRLAAWLPQE